MPLWWLTKDGDVASLALYERHYSAHCYRDGRVRKLFMGPGEKVVLRTIEGGAVFGWRKFRDASKQAGINCSVFRNESPHQSSELIRQADAIAFAVWPHCRHYTYVDPTRVKSRNPGFCFLKAGWRKCGTTKGGLLIMERLAEGREQMTIQFIDESIQAEYDELVARDEALAKELADVQEQIRTIVRVCEKK